MKQNMGTADRIIRTMIVLIIAFLYMTGQITGVAAIILGVIAVVFLLTSIFGVCPAYLPLKLSTKGKQAEH